MELVHIDVCGPTRIGSLNGGSYFMLLIDDYSIMTWVNFLMEKSQVLDRFKVFKFMVENEVKLESKCLRSC